MPAGKGEGPHEGRKGRWNVAIPIYHFDRVATALKGFCAQFFPQGEPEGGEGRNRTHPGADHASADGFEDRGGHQARVTLRTGEFQSVAPGGKGKAPKAWLRRDFRLAPLDVGKQPAEIREELLLSRDDTFKVMDVWAEAGVVDFLDDPGIAFHEQQAPVLRDVGDEQTGKIERPLGPERLEGRLDFLFAMREVLKAELLDLGDAHAPVRLDVFLAIGAENAFGAHFAED